jgi:hypothetical protein
LFAKRGSFASASPLRQADQDNSFNGENDFILARRFA